MAIFFLNCTKNIELTRDQFARTVTFALTNILTSFPGSYSTVSHSKNRTRGSAT